MYLTLKHMNNAQLEYISREVGFVLRNIFNPVDCANCRDLSGSQFISRAEFSNRRLSNNDHLFNIQFL